MATPPIQEAIRLHQAGDLAGAATVYRAVLAVEPTNVIAMHYLGVIAHQTGQPDAAMKLMRESIALNPSVPDFHCNLGVLLRDCQRYAEAAAALCAAVRLRPKYAEALNNLGDVLRLMGKLAESEEVLQQSIRLRPSFEALHNLALVLIELNRPAQAVVASLRALGMNPDSMACHKTLANAMRLSGDAAGAVGIAKSAIALDPSDADAWFGLGNALRVTGDLPEAAEAYRRAAAVRPNHSDLLNNLAATYIDLAEVDAAVQIARQSVALNPQSPQAKYNLSLSLLLGGEYEEGWECYESRWQCEGFAGTLAPLDKPQWDGSDPAGKTILIRAEQGSGDTIQFARYLPMLASRGTAVVLQCQAGLKTLLSGLPGVSRTIARGEPLGDFDAHLPLLSLPRWFGTTVETIPSHVPYFRADATRSARWNAKFAAIRGLKCGVVWAGNLQHKNDRNRSLALARLAPLFDLPDVAWISLQKGEPAEQLRLCGRAIMDVGDDLEDFADTAVCLSQLDLLISVDTSVAHLAGAMGKPVWTLIPFAPDWRWLLNRPTTPWYPTMRLFRQTSRGDWTSVIHHVAHALSEESCRLVAAA